MGMFIFLFTQEPSQQQAGPMDLPSPPWFHHVYGHNMAFSNALCVTLLPVLLCNY